MTDAVEPPFDCRRVAYEGRVCPRCGYDLAPPDANLDRRCLLCPVTVRAAEEWIEDATD